MCLNVFKAYGCSFYFHQQVFWEIIFNSSCIIEPVMSTVNSAISSWPVLSDSSLMACQGLSFFFLQLFELRAKTEIFLNEKNSPHPLLHETEELWKFTFDEVLMFLNEFDLKLQGKTALIYEPYTMVVISTLTLSDS